MTTTFVQPTSAPDGRPAALAGPGALGGHRPPGSRAARRASSSGPSLAAHREQYGAARRCSTGPHCSRDLHRIGLRGRGGAAFPFATKLSGPRQWPPGPRGQPERGRAGQRQGHRPGTDAPAPRPRRRGGDRPGPARPRGARRAARGAAVAGRRDADGARRAGRPGPDPDPHRRAALRRRPGQRGRRAAGRPAEPARTSWAPEAVAGHQGRPTLLSNGETWARIGLLALRGAARLRPARHPRRARGHAADPRTRRARSRWSARRRTATGCASWCPASGTDGRCWSAGSTARGPPGTRWPACGSRCPGCARWARRSAPACSCRSAPRTARST